MSSATKHDITRYSHPLLGLQLSDIPAKLNHITFNPRVQYRLNGLYSPNKLKASMAYIYITYIMYTQCYSRDPQRIRGLRINHMTVPYAA